MRLHANGYATGDTANPLMWLLIAIAGIGLIGGVFASKKFLKR